MPNAITPGQAAYQFNAAEENRFAKECATINALLRDNYGRDAVGYLPPSRFLDRLKALYENAGWHVEYNNDGLAFSHPAEDEHRQPIVIEDEYMRIELVPVDRNGSDVLYGDVRWTGSSLRVTIKRGVIADAQALNVGSRGYTNLVSEEPTVLFSMVEPNR